MSADQIEIELRAAMAREDWAAVNVLEAKLFGLAKPVVTPATVRIALWYAEQGLHVFPLQPESKIPYSKTHGCKDATTSEAVIRQWWEWYPDSNIGIATGHLVDVIDIDGPIGVRSWSRAVNLPPILGTVSTPRNGGSHLYVPASGDGNAAGIFEGIDYRGVGGYVVAPPSVNADGRSYRWRRPLDVKAMHAAAAA